MNITLLNEKLKISENINSFSNYVNKKELKPSFLKDFEIEAQFRDGIFQNEYVIILKNTLGQYYKIVGFYSSYYGIVFDESSKFVEVKPKLVTVTKFESIKAPLRI